MCPRHVIRTGLEGILVRSICEFKRRINTMSKKKNSVSESRKGTCQRMEEVLDVVRGRSESPGAVNVLSWPEDFECGCFS